MRGPARRASVIASVALGLAALTAPLAHADPTTEPPAQTCSPQIHELPTFEGSFRDENVVNGLSLEGDLAVGESQGLPAYWVGDVVHRVPMPKGYNQGAVLAVNRFGLMVGYVTTGARYGPSRAFRYWPGNPAITFYPSWTGHAVDINDAGQAVGWSQGPNGFQLVEYGPGIHLSRTLTVPDGYRPVTAHFDYSGLGINNSGFVIAGGDRGFEGGGSAVQSFIWPPSGSEPQPLRPLPRLIPDVPPPPPGDYPIPVYRSFIAAAIDNKNRMVGQAAVDIRADVATGDVRPRSISWSSRVSLAVDVAFAPAREVNDSDGQELGQSYLDPLLLAMGDRSGIAAGTATPFADREGHLPEYAVENVAVVWDGTGPIRALPRLALTYPTGAYAAQDDGRVGGWAFGFEGRVPVVWTCATGR